MIDPLQSNRLAWDEKARIHLQGHPIYPIADFIAGKAGLNPNTPDNLLPVQSKSLLHLQCHFGMDTLMWARNGAIVTGVDFSPVAIAAAKNLAAETRLPATFIESDIADLPNHLAGNFDIVLTYFGTITWLPDLDRWARVIAHFLKPGAFFYIADSHPLAHTLDVKPGDTHPTQIAPYFPAGKPTRYESPVGTYADPTAPRIHTTTYEWQHTLADILNSLIAAELRIDYLHEFPHTFYNLFYDSAPHLMQPDSRHWWHLDQPNQMPLMFSLKASRP